MPGPLDSFRRNGYGVLSFVYVMLKFSAAHVLEEPVWAVSAAAGV
jgi:hypothetical protein